LSKNIFLVKRANTCIFKKAKKNIGIKEYILYQLTGEYKIDYSIASARIVLIIHECFWDKTSKVDWNEEFTLSEPVDVGTIDGMQLKRVLLTEMV